VTAPGLTRPAGGARSPGTLAGRGYEVLAGRPGLVRTLSVVAFVGCWQWGAEAGVLDPRFYSSPTEIVAAGIELFRTTQMREHFAVTGAELGAGYLLGAALAVLAGFLMGYYRWFGALTDPIVMALYVTPRLAIYPVLVIWFGLGMGSKVTMVFLGTFFMVLINTIAGVRDVDQSLVRAARSFLAGRAFILRKVVIPATVPSIMTGLRQGFSQAVIAVITAEMFLSMSGLGNLITTYGQATRVDTLMFIVLMVSALAYLAIRGLSALEDRVSAWRPR
jgi:NitT/TauT family transport system permease protein